MTERVIPQWHEDIKNVILLNKLIAWATLYYFWTALLYYIRLRQK